MSEWVVRKILPDGRAIEKKISDPGLASEWTERAANDDRYEIEKVPSANGASSGPPVDKEMPLGESALRILAQGAQLGWNDELMAKGKELGDRAAQASQDLGYKPTIPDYLSEERAKVESAKKQLGPLSYLVEGAGGMLVPGAHLMKGVGPALRVADAAITGGAYKLGASDDKKPSDAIIGMAAGSVLGSGAEVVAPIARASARSRKNIINKIIPESPEENLYKMRAKKDVGLSREELAKQELSTLQERQKNLQSEMDKNSELIAKHGERAKESIRRDLQTNITNDISEIYALKDEVLDAAHTGLKGSKATEGIKSHVSAMSDAQKKPFQAKVFSRAEKHLNALDDTLAGISKRAKGRRASTSAGTQASQIQTAIDDYRRIINDQTTSPYLGLGKGGVDPNVMSDTYIALDNIKRSLGIAQKKIKEDPTSRDAIKSAYMNLRKFLEDEKVWGPEVTEMQRELNSRLTDDLSVSTAFESTFMRPQKKASKRGADPFTLISEADPVTTKRIISDPDSPDIAPDMENLERWLTSTGELSNEVVKRYKDTPELAAKVQRIKELSDRVRSRLDLARTDAARSTRVGVEPTEAAMEESKVFLGRGIPETENIREIRRLRGENERLGGKALESDTAVSNLRTRELEPTDDPNIMRRRLESDKEYQARLDEKTESYRDIDRTPLERMAVKSGRGIAKAGKSLAGLARGRQAGMVGGKVGSFISQMWGDRPISELAKTEDVERDPRLDAALRVRSYRQNTDNPKINNVQ